MSREVLALADIDIDALLADPEAVRIIGREGRGKLLYHVPEGFECCTVTLIYGEKNKNERMIFELRYKAQNGRTVQDVLPPSIHPDTGKPYELVGDITKIPPLPQALADLWKHWEEWKPVLQSFDPHYTEAINKAEKPKTKARAAQVEGAIDPIRVFNEQHSIHKVLTSHGYKQKGKRYIRPGSTSGIPGIVLLNDNHIFSHGRDVLADGHKHDAFDIYRLLSCGGNWKQALAWDPEITRHNQRAWRLLKANAAGKEPPWKEATGELPEKDDHWPRLEESDEAEALDSDRANAVRLARVFGQQLLHVERIGWHTWTGTHWRRSDEEAVRVAAQLSRVILKEAAILAEEASREASEERREILANRAGKLATCAHKSESRVRVDAALWFARALLNIHIEELNRELYALNVQNGVIDLHTGELREHRRTDFITRCCPVAYDPKAKAPKWGTFLRRIFADNVAVIDFVQRAAGYSLTGDTGEQCLFILHGSGANGKSVLLEVLGRMLGAYAKQAAPDLLLAKNQDRHPTEVADLFGSRLVTAVETSEGRRLAEALVKQMTSGDKMRARFMRQDFFEFDTTHKLWLATNHKPQVRGTDYAIWRRIRLIPFEVTIPEDKRDPKLAAKLIAEELPGILTWAVQGCLAWQKKGLKPPEKVQAATKAYREEMDVLAGFLGECCVIHTNANARASALYTAYKKWCETAGEYCVSQTIFGGQLTERGFERYTNNGVWYQGIGLVADPPGG
jgi:putative DNA primase/helicase